MRARAPHFRPDFALAAALLVSCWAVRVQAETPHLQGFSVDGQLVGGGGLGFGGKLSNYFLGRARLGALYADQPWMLNAGITFDVGALAGFGAGAELEFNTWLGPSAHVGIERVDDKRWMTHLAIGYTVLSLEWQHRFSAAVPTDALMLEVRLPFGIWWFLKRSKSAENTVATVRQAEPPRTIPPPPAALPSIPKPVAPEPPIARSDAPNPPPSAANSNGLPPSAANRDDPPPSAAGEDVTRLVTAAEREHAAGHDTEAVAAYERAYQLGRDPAILWSLAQAEIARGWFVAALDPLQRFSALAESAEARAEALRKLAELQHRLAHLRLELLHAHGDERIELDGKLEPSAGLGYDVAIDPGDHLFVIARGGRTLARRSFHADEAELVRSRVDLEAGDQ